MHLEEQEKKIEEINQLMADLKIQPIKVYRPVSEDDVLYLLNRCPYLYLAQPEALGDSEHVKPETRTPLLRHEVPMGWSIHDYGSLVTASPGKWLLAHAGETAPLRHQDHPGLTQDSDWLDFDPSAHVADGEDEDGKGGDGRGTWVKQAVVTAQAMVALLHKKGWEQVVFMDGHPMMAWAAWVEAVELGIEVTGYYPAKSDQEKYQRIAKRSAAQEQVIMAKK